MFSERQVTVNVSMKKQKQINTLPVCAFPNFTTPPPPPFESNPHPPNVSMLLHHSA